MPEQQAIHFNNLREADLQEWRDLPVSKLFLQALQMDIRQCEIETIARAVKGDNIGATASAGAADRLLAIFNNCTQPRLPAEPSSTDTTFVDPRKRRKNGLGQTSTQ